MNKRYLVPGDVDCAYTETCNKICYNNCSRCETNTVAVKRHKKEQEKKNYFKRICEQRKG